MNDSGHSMPITVSDMQEQAAALLSQLHQQDPSRGTPHLQPHPRGTLHQVDRRPARQPLPLTPGMGSVGSISPERDAGTHRGREGGISHRINEQQPWWVPSSTMITYKPDQAAMMLLYTSQDADFHSSERCLSCSPNTVMIAGGMMKQPLLI